MYLPLTPRLKPELSEEVKHEAGTVGAWHGEEVETAACKFYITLERAPWMDGNWTVFGRVTQGLDVVRAIRGQPVRMDEKERPARPVIIRTVTVDQAGLTDQATHLTPAQVKGGLGP